MAGSFLIIGEIDETVRRVSIAAPDQPGKIAGEPPPDPPEHGNHFIDPVGPAIWADCG